MPAGRSQSLVASCDQWLRATHDGTAVLGPRAELMLTWPDPIEAAGDVEGPGSGDGSGACPARGMAVDRLCRLYQLHADSLDRLLLGPTAAGVDYARLPDPVVLIGPPAAGTSGSGPDFEPAPTPALVDPTGLAVDDDDRLFVADRGRRTIAVIDLWSRRLLREARVATPRHPDRHPMGLGERGGVVHAAVRSPSGLLRLTATRGPEELPLPGAVADLPPDAEPARVAVLDDGTPVVLFLDPAGDGWLVAGERPPRAVGRASDVTVDAEGAVVVAPCPDTEAPTTVLRRFVPTPTGWTRAEPLDARGYDGGGIVATRDGRIAYSTAAGVRLAVRAHVTYAMSGTCTTFRLDSGVPRNRWGRLTIEACIPDGTECLVATVTADDEFATQTAHVLPEPAPDCPPLATPDPPPLPPDFLALGPLSAVSGRLHRRGAPITPWWTPDGPHETFEAPVTAPPGRYLWVTLRLTGNGRRTPRVREVRVERTAHSLMRRLPAVYSADERQAEFLHRYLATFDGLLHDLDIRSRCREILVDPAGTPVEALDWLASFMGLVLDDRWHEAARRRLVAEIATLYRRRGTLGALERYLAIYLAGHRAEGDDATWLRPIIVEHFRLRGAGAPDAAELAPSSLLDRLVPASLAGARVPGARTLGGSGERVGTVVGQPGRAAYATHAHRFSVLVPAPLTAEQEAVVRHVLDTERPAHTAYELCTLESGMRVGRGLHLGLSSTIGRTGEFEPAIADRTAVGGGAILGGRRTGVAVEASRLDVTARVG